jgi:hypothetical protein
MMETDEKLIGSDENMDDVNFIKRYDNYRNKSTSCSTNVKYKWTELKS